MLQLRMLSWMVKRTEALGPSCVSLAQCLALASGNLALGSANNTISSPILAAGRNLPGDNGLSFAAFRKQCHERTKDVGNFSSH